MTTFKLLNIYKLYRNVYKSVLLVFYKGWKSNYPEWNAAITIPVVLLLNFVIVLGALGLTTEVEKYVNGEEAAVVLYLLLVTLNYLLFIRGKKYDDMIAEFEIERTSGKRFRFWLGLTFSIGGFLFPILYMFLNLESID